MKITFSQRRKRQDQLIASMYDYAQMFILGACFGMLVALLWHNYNL